MTALTLGAQVRFVATTQARQVVVNGVFEVSFTLENAEGRDFQPPPFTSFEVISGPSMSMSTTIINGRRSQSRSYRYTLMAEQEGIFTIGPATIRTGSQVLATDPLTVEVVKGRAGTTSDGQTVPTDEEVFLRMVVDTTKAHPGQQLRIDYKLYTTVNIRNYSTLKEDGYEDFFFRYVKDFTERAYLEVVDGIQYKVQTLKSLALFPQQTGSITIEPLVINVGVGVRDTRRSFFFNTRTIPKTLRSNDVTIEVVPVPEPQPATFTGAVGSYQMDVQINRRELTTDDALVLTVLITGDGDAKRWAPPTLDYLGDRFEMYDPKILQDRFVDVGGVMENTKQIEYLLIPRNPGLTSFQVDFTYYDVDSSAYVTLQSRPIALNVRPGDGTTNDTALIADEMASRDITGLRSPKQIRHAAPVFLFSPLYWILLAIPLLMLSGATVIRRRRLAFAGLDPAERKRLRALKTAMRHLETARSLVEGDSRPFYESISLALFSYVSSKLRIAPSELTKDNLLRRMEEAGIDATQRAAVMDVVRRCELVLYAGGADAQSHQAVYDETLELITGIERSLT